ncbi:hypothetical protein IAG41_04490 [Sphingomonas sp. JC676]|uniref:hypothetical protein n=1 Tax=Sphingomonas sp. JC676 TaxID=2768065 RepID=UPI00165862FC|nr:hypothetical protein [Sphingomonas sp. JC676]MBC9031642.1 hypothetical protein [Sphingomonas sp. JC676]
MKMLVRAGALLCALECLTPNVAFAQTESPGTISNIGNVRQVAITTGDLGDTAAPVSDTNGLPVKCVSGCGDASAALQNTLNGYVDGLEAGIGTPIDGAYTGSGSASMVAILKGIYNSSVDTTPVAVTQSGSWTLGGISGTISLPTGAATAANQTALNALFPTSLGPKSNSGSLAVVASKSATGTGTTTPASASAVKVLNANAARSGCSIVNDSTSNARINLGTTVSTTLFTAEMLGSTTAPHAQFICPSDWTGEVWMIWDTATGNARANERTP